jgi:hypothetical protein
LRGREGERKTVKKGGGDEKNIREPVGRCGWPGEGKGKGQLEAKAQPYIVS